MILNKILIYTFLAVITNENENPFLSCLTFFFDLICQLDHRALKKTPMFYLIIHFYPTKI